MGFVSPPNIHSIDTLFVLKEAALGDGKKGKKPGHSEWSQNSDCLEIALWWPIKKEKKKVAS